ncbi:MAG: PIN domain-containing protein, partial [Candidatus Acidiferrum sp.]
MSRRFLLDTNIFVYSLDRTAAAKSLHARELIREAIEKHQGIVSYQVVQEFFNVAFHRFAKPMSLADAEQYLATTFRPLLAVHSSQALLAEAMRLKDRFQLPWYDALIVVSALEGECATLFS